MNVSGASSAVEYLRTLFEAETLVALSDGQLLDRFVERQDQTALEALVQRHGPMVWGVCRRVLRDHHDAEDAFQATFLVLARRAGSVMPRERVGNWLYGVAYQTALKARATRAKRRTRECDSADTPEPEIESQAPRNELTELLDQELSRLPDKYRTPIVLCELQGKSHGEAAEQLGWPIGTVSGRLSRARAMLAKRLTRQGVLASAGALAAALGENQLAAGAPAALRSATIQAAILFAESRSTLAGIVSADVAALTRKVLKSMYFSKLKTTTAIAIAALLTLTLAGAGIWQARSLADGKAAGPESFHVTVNEIIQGESALVTQLDIEAPPGSTIDMSADKDKDNAFSLSLSTAPSDPNQPNGMSHFRLTILADQIECKEGPTNAYKFMLAYKLGMISSSTSDTGLMPAGAKQLSDVVTILMKPGDYKFGEPTKLVKYKDKTYSIVVNRPK